MRRASMVTRMRDWNCGTGPSRFLKTAYLLAMPFFCLTAAQAQTVPASTGHWRAIGPWGGRARSIAIDPNNSTILLAGGARGLLFRSSNSARSWQRLPLPDSIAGSVQVISIDSANSAHYWIGVGGGVESDRAAGAGLWESNDSGIHWQQASQLVGLPIESMARFAGDARIMAVGTRKGVYLSKDGGHTWMRISPADNPELQDITALSFDPADSGTLFAGTPHLPWKTSDGGANWKSAHTGMLDDSDVFSISADSSRPGLIYASACSGIYQSTTGGESWKLLDGIPNTSRRTHVILPDPLRKKVLYVGTTEGIFKSWNGGTRWNHLNNTQVNAIAMDPKDTRILYLATERGIITTNDGGQTFAAANDGFLSRNIISVAVTAKTLVVSTLYERQLGGVWTLPLTALSAKTSPEWTQTPPEAFDGIDVRAVIAAGDTLYAASGDTVFRWAPASAKWSPLPPLDELIDALAFPKDGLLTASTANGLFRFDGTKWNAAPDTGPSARLLRLGIDSSFSPPAASPEPPNDVAISCSKTVLAATARGLFVAAAPGKWQPAPGRLGDASVSTAVFHPQNCSLAYAAQFASLYTSADAGVTWNPFPAAGLDAPLVGRLIFAGSKLLAVVPGQGVYVWEP